jgi:hypothetical protein
VVDGEYLEKIVQISYRIPPPDTEQIRRLVASYARSSGTEELFTPALEALLAEGTGRNPRRIKRLLNSFVMYQMDPQWRQFGSETVLRTVLLHHLYPDFHRAVAQPGGRDVVEDFVRYHLARAALRPGTAIARDEAFWTNLDELAERLELARPARTVDFSPETYLQILEAALPGSFPALATDPMFVALITEIHQLPRSRELRRRIQRTILQPQQPPAVAP